MNIHHLYTIAAKWLARALFFCRRTEWLHQAAQAYSKVGTLGRVHKRQAVRVGRLLGKPPQGSLQSREDAAPFLRRSVRSANSVLGAEAHQRNASPSRLLERLCCPGKEPVHLWRLLWPCKMLPQLGPSVGRDQSRLEGEDAHQSGRGTHEEVAVWNGGLHTGGKENAVHIWRMGRPELQPQDHAARVCGRHGKPGLRLEQ